MSDNKDYSLLRPFDLEAAKRGEAVCWHDAVEEMRYVGPSTGDGTAGCFEWLEGKHVGTFETYPASAIRMAPLCWVEGKPVYQGDVLHDKKIGAVTAKRDKSFVGGVCFKNNKGNGFAALSAFTDSLTWTPPTRKVTRYINIYPEAATPQGFGCWLHPSPEAAAKDASHRPDVAPICTIQVEFEVPA